MTNKYYYLLLLPILAFVIVVVSGFWFVNRNTDAGSKLVATDDNIEQPYIHPVAEADPESYEVQIERLKLAIKKFRNAKTFKAVIDEERDEGKFHSEITYVKPLRMQATISIDNDPGFDMIIVGETAYAKAPEDSWKMTNDETIRKFGSSFFKAMISTDDTLLSFGIPENATFTIRKNARDDCDEFLTDYESGEVTYPISFCVNEVDELVKLTKQNKDGEVTTKYSEFNSFFTIERPVLPLLEPIVEFDFSNLEE